ncbi:MAG: chemotaxis protein [Lachnospiraceae bacterium]|nr:chemotaxis protein [Lachnospiraceae bacterium]
MENKAMSETGRNNRVSMIMHAVVAGVMLIFYLLQLSSGLRSGGLVLIDILLGLGPVAAELYFWRRNHDAAMIKHLVAIGFAVFYTYSLFTTINSLVFVLVIPMIMVVSVYNDTKYSVEINIGTVVLSIIAPIYWSKTGMQGYDTQDNMILQIVIMLLTAVASYLTSKILRQNNKQKIDAALEAQNHAETVLKDLVLMSEKMHEGIKEIYEDLYKLNTASQTTREAMQQLSKGAADTADAVQKQTFQTEEIQNKVNMVTDAAEGIAESMQKTVQVLDTGNKDVEILVRQVEASVQNGAQVAEKLQNLDQNVEEMHSIVKLISGIANQTSMLALNASIEAARAGEQGKGFAVVASQVTGMAAQTKDATARISDMIDHVSTAIMEVVQVIHQMLEGIHEEKQSTTNTAESFENIQKNTAAVQQNVESLARSIGELKEANAMIVESIQTISAVSEEVSAHANNTAEAEESNAVTINQIDAKMGDLIQYIKSNKKVC